jgi:hypothetical protein
MIPLVLHRVESPVDKSNILCIAPLGARREEVR